MKKILITGLLVGSSVAFAHDNWISTSGDIVKNSYGQCWRNGVWTPATAAPGCDGDLKPAVKPVVSAPAPVVMPTLPPPAPAVKPPVQTKTLTNVVYQAETLFDFDKSVIKPEGRAILNGFITSLNGSQAKYDVVVVIGHTDSIGSDAYNMRLGQRRAEAVKAFLVSAGISANSIRTSSKGEREPIADNKTAAGRAKNRRVEIKIEAVVSK